MEAGAPPVVAVAGQLHCRSPARAQALAPRLGPQAYSHLWVTSCVYLTPGVA